MTETNTSLSIYDNFAQSKDIANYLAGSDLIPPHFQKKPSNIIIALEFAQRNNIAPFAAMQSMYVVHGRVGMSTSMAISLARKHNVWKSLRYETKGEGESLSVKAIAVLHDGSEVDTTISLAMAHSAGWTKNVIYKSIPEQMLKYRAAIFLIRSNFPEILFGLQTTEEIQDVYESKQVTQEDRKQAIEAQVVTQPDSINVDDTSLLVVDDFERDIEDYRSELLEFIGSSGQEFFDKLGKDRQYMLDKIEATKNIQSMKTIYDVVKAV
jgi:hypothetical protein